MTINDQKNEINELKTKIKSDDVKLKKMEQSTISMGSQLDQANMENINFKTKINELEMKIKCDDLKLKKMELSTISMKNQLDRATTENIDLERKINELQDLLNKER